MRELSDLGRVLFALAVLALGVQACVCSAFLYELEPVPAWVPAQVFLANLTGFFLVAVGLGLLLRNRARLAAAALGAMLLLWVLVLHLPLLLPDPAPDLSFAFETLALSGAAWVLAVEQAGNDAAPERHHAALERAALLGRCGFGAALVAFCAVNFIYHRFIAGMIPGWIPERLSWAYFTGLASLAAGLSVLSGVQVRLALRLLGVMYGSWVLLIHLPYLAVHPHSRSMWTDMFITLALAGGSWLLAGSEVVRGSVLDRLRKGRRSSGEARAAMRNG